MAVPAAPVVFTAGFGVECPLRSLPLAEDFFVAACCAAACIFLRSTPSRWRVPSMTAITMSATIYQ